MARLSCRVGAGFHRPGGFSIVRGLTSGEIVAHLAEVYGMTTSKETVSTITDRALESMAEWRTRPLDPGRFPLIVATQ